MQAQWSKISENLEKKLDSGFFNVWISPLAGEVEGNTIHLEAPNPFIASWVQKRFVADIVAAAKEVLGDGDWQVILVASKGGSTPASQVDEPRSDGIMPVAAVQHRLPLRMPKNETLPTWQYSFDDFVVGPANNVAFAAACDVSLASSHIKTLFVNSSSGLGKTHLSQAIGQRASVQEQNRVAYLTAEDFATQFVSALRCHEVEAFKSRMQDLDVLLLEDVHFLQGKEKMQDMALGVVKGIQARGGKVVFTSSFAPRELQDMDSQLVSHFCSGILADMERPTRAMRCDILSAKAQALGEDLPEDVRDLIADRLHGDVRQLESCLNTLFIRSKVLGRPVARQLAIEVLSQYVAAGQEASLPDFVRLVCESFGLDQRRIYSKTRQQEYVLGRNTIYFLARKHTDLSLEEIGATFNRRHSTVIKGITSLEREMASQSRLGRQVRKTVGLIERNAGLAKTSR